MNTETTQKIHDDAQQDFEKLTSLLIVAKSLYDEQPQIWQGMDAKISSVVGDIRDLLIGWNPRFSYLGLVQSINCLRGFIDGIRRSNKLDELYVTKIDMNNFGSFDEYDEFEHAVNIQWCDFGSLYAFDAEHSDEYFSIFLPLLKDFADKNPSLFAMLERKRGASIRLVWDDDASA